MRSNIFDNPFAEPKQRKDDDVGLARLLLGEEAAKEMARVSSPPKEKGQVNWNLGVTEEERRRGKSIESNPQYLLEQAKEIFGEDFHGKEAVESAFGITLKPKDIPPFPYSLKDLEKTKELKAQGIEEMCVLFVSSIEGKPLTGELLNTLIQKKYEEMGLGKFLYTQDWYHNASFYTEPVLKLEWKIITKSCIPDSKNKRHHWEKGDPWKHEDTQEYVIEQYAKTHDIPRDHLHRPEPFEMLYAVALHLIDTEERNGKGQGERLFANENHWSDTRSDGYLVRVGYAVRVGAYVDRDIYDFSGGGLGACLSRGSS